MAPQDNPLCGFCHRGKDVMECGPLRRQLLRGKVVAAHQRCMQYSSGLVQSTSPQFGGFEIDEVETEIQRGKKLSCTWCKKQKKKVGFRWTGATAGCEIERCKHSYHYNCARLHAVTSRRIRKENNNTFLLFRVFCGQEHKVEYVETKIQEGVDEQSSSETDYDDDSLDDENESSDDDGGGAGSSLQEGFERNGCHKRTKSRTLKIRRSISAIQSSVMKGGTSSSSSTSPTLAEDGSADLTTKGPNSKATTSTVDETDHTDEEINEIMKHTSAHKKDRCSNQRKKTRNGKIGNSTDRGKSSGNKGKSSADSDSRKSGGNKRKLSEDSDKGSKFSKQNLQKTRIKPLVISSESDQSEDESNSYRKATKRKGKHLKDVDSSSRRLSKQKQRERLSETVSDSDFFPEEDIYNKPDSKNISSASNSPFSNFKPLRTTLSSEVGDVQNKTPILLSCIPPSSPVYIISEDDELPCVTISSAMPSISKTVRVKQEPEKEQDSHDSFNIDSDTGCEQPVKQNQIESEKPNEDTRENENALNERVNEESTAASEESDSHSDSILLDPLTCRTETRPVEIAASSVNFLGLESNARGTQNKPLEINPALETVFAEKHNGNGIGDFNDIPSSLNSGSAPNSLGDATEASSETKRADRNFVEKTHLRWLYCSQSPDLHALMNEISFSLNDGKKMDSGSGLHDAATGTGIEPWWDTLKDDEECILVIPSYPKKLENLLAVLKQKLVEEQKIRAEHVHFWNAITPLPLHPKFMLYYLADVAEALVSNVEKAKIKQHCSELQLYLMDHQTIQNQCSHVYAVQLEQNWGLDHVQDWTQKIGLSFSKARDLTQYPIGMFTSWRVTISGVDTTINYALIFLNNMSDPDQTIRAALHKEVAMYNWLGGATADAESPSFSGLSHEQMEAYKLQETFLLKNWLLTTFSKFCQVVTLPDEDIFRHSGGDDNCFKSFKETVDAMSIEAEPNFPVAFFVHRTNPDIVQFSNFLQACLGKYSGIFPGHRLLWIFHAGSLGATEALQIFNKVSGQYKVRLLSAFNPANKPVSVMVADMDTNY